MKAKKYLLLVPALAIIVVLFVGGLLLSAANSFFLFGDSSLTFAAYKEIFADREFQTALIFTFILAVISTLLSAVGGLSLAILLFQQTGKSAILKTLLQIPIAIPHLAAAFIFLNLFSPSGLIARIFVNNQADFPILINDAYGFGIVAAYVFKETPFVALVVLTALTRSENEYKQVAQTLGASKWQQFRFVTLPFVAPSLKFASLIVFAFIFGAFEIPFVLGRQFPTVLAVIGNRKFFSTDLNERPEAFALAVLMTVAASIFVWFYLRLMKNASDTDKAKLF